MTVKEALEKSIEMWQYIKDNKCRDKGQYFANTNKKYVRCYCYLCEYSYNRCGCCGLCPVENWAIKGYTKYCCDIGSVYLKYHRCDVEAYEMADDMLFVLKRELNELNKQN